MQGLYYIPDANLALNNRKLIAAGPLTRQPGTAPYRIVLLEWPDKKLSVHNEVFVDDDLAQEAIDAGRAVSGLTQGYYFADEFALVNAMEKFAQRLQNTNDYLLSLYR